MRKDNTIKAFFALVQGGLWERDVFLQQYGSIDYGDVMLLAEEQSMVGLVTAGLEHVKDVKVPQEILLQFIGETLQIEQANIEMNAFISALVEKMRKADIYSLLLKGQGVAQCYERPLWRACGDVDLLVGNNYEESKTFLSLIASSADVESVRTKHIGYTIDSWTVELHGTLHCALSKKMDNAIDEFQNEVFERNLFRTWNNDGANIMLADPNYDILFVFTHFVKHFYKGGLGIRQVCDWCRLLWAYQDEIDQSTLKIRLAKLGIIKEWMAFGAFTVDYLGMPSNVMPLYEDEKRWHHKAERICAFIISSGNFGHNRENGYYSKYPFIIRKFISMNRRIKDVVNHAFIFPKNSIVFLPYIVYNGLKAAINGE